MGRSHICHCSRSRSHGTNRSTSTSTSLIFAFYQREMVKLTPKRIFCFGESQVFLQSTKSQSRKPLSTLPLKSSSKLLLFIFKIILQCYLSWNVKLTFSEFSNAFTLLKLFSHCPVFVFKQMHKWRENWNQKLFPPGLEPGTFRVLGERDNHYTTETWML